MGFDLNNLVRDNIKRLIPYSSARSEFAGNSQLFLDANENSFGSPLNADYSRYPDPLQTTIKQRVAGINGVQPSEIFVGNGSDEAIDLLFRIFCRPRIDNVLICPPTYGMYEVAAGINDLAVLRVNLTENFLLNTRAMLEAVSERTKIIFLCSPNNPTGNLLERSDVIKIVETFNGIVVIDEAYVQFAGAPSFVREVAQFPNLVVLQTFSKAWGLAGLRVGLAFANAAIIGLFNKVKPPYNISQIAQENILSALANQMQVDAMVAAIVNERKSLSGRLGLLSFIERVYPSDANFLLIKTRNATGVYNFLLEEKIVVRNRSNVELCDGCLRITVGTPEENRTLLEALKKYETDIIH